MKNLLVMAGLESLGHLRNDDEGKRLRVGLGKEAQRVETPILGVLHEEVSLAFGINEGAIDLEDPV